MVSRKAIGGRSPIYRGTPILQNGYGSYLPFCVPLILSPLTSWSCHSFRCFCICRYKCHSTTANGSFSAPSLRGGRNLSITCVFLSFKPCSLLDTHICWINEDRNAGGNWIDWLSWFDVYITRPKSVPVFSPAYLDFYIASEQHYILVQRDQLLFPIDNLKWFLCLLTLLKFQRGKMDCLWFCNRSLHNIVFYTLSHGFD